jgi:lysophospholipase L1-like esterase
MLRRVLVAAGIVTTSSLLFAIFVEGIFSLYQGFSALRPAAGVAERSHTAHDELLGWANVTGLELRDFYAPDRHLTINDQGFRASQEYAADVPAGRVRVIASGDSFTLGYGVDDTETWPARLERALPSTQTVNLGQGGYGVDQMLLWYERDGKKFEHQIHLFTFISEDFTRALSDEFLGYPKPLLSLHQNRIVVANLPIPTPGFWSTMRRAPFKLKAFRTIDTLLDFGAAQYDANEARRRRESEQARLFPALFERLKRVTEANKARLIVVHLPTFTDLQFVGPIAFNQRLAELLQTLEIPYWDLREDFASFSNRDKTQLFIGPEDPASARFEGATGHFNARGNDFVARTLARRLTRAGDGGGIGSDASTQPEPTVKTP